MVLVHRRLVLVHCHQYSVAAQGWIHQHLCERQRPRRPVFDTVRDMHADGTHFFFNLLLSPNEFPHHAAVRFTTSTSTSSTAPCTHSSCNIPCHCIRHPPLIVEGTAPSTKCTTCLSTPRPSPPSPSIPLRQVSCPLSISLSCSLFLGSALQC